MSFILFIFLARCFFDIGLCRISISCFVLFFFSLITNDDVNYFIFFALEIYRFEEGNEILIRIITTSILSSFFALKTCNLNDMALYIVNSRPDLIFICFLFTSLFFLSSHSFSVIRRWQRWRVILFVVADFWFNFNFVQICHDVDNFFICVCGNLMWMYINLHSDSTRYAHFIQSILFTKT